MKDEKGFTLIEVAIASVITMLSLVFLASLFTLALGQNRLNKQFTSTTALSQKKIEELMAIERNDARLTIGGGLDDSSKQAGYYDQLYVDDSQGITTTTIPSGKTANYSRYWKIEADPGSLSNTVLISVRVVALQSASQGKTREQTTLATVRSW